MARLLGLPEHTLFAELMERSLDAMFDEQFSENGTFVKRGVANRDGTLRRYWYYQGYRPGAEANGRPKRYGRYVGPADDPAIAERVARFRELKSARGERAHLVDALVGAGMPRPPVVMGRIVEALAKAGVFHLRAVLVGTVAYQTYGGVIGALPTQTAAMTGDVDVAQFRSISIGVEDSVPDMPEVLRSVDPSFRPVPSLTAGSNATIFVNQAGFRVDFLTPHRGSDEQMRSPTTLPALGGVSAQPLRFMDFLIRNPVRSVLLHGPGVSVAVPAPERFAVHKLILSGRRHQDAVGAGKSRKDIVQAGEIIEALALAERLHVLAPSLTEAWERGPEWQRLIALGAAKLKPSSRAIVEGLDLTFVLERSSARSNEPVSDASP